MTRLHVFLLCLMLLAGTGSAVGQSLPAQDSLARAYKAIIEKHGIDLTEATPFVRLLLQPLFPVDTTKFKPEALQEYRKSKAFLDTVDSEMMNPAILDTMLSGLPPLRWVPAQLESVKLQIQQYEEILRDTANLDETERETFQWQLDRYRENLPKLEAYLKMPYAERMELYHQAAAQMRKWEQNTEETYMQPGIEDGVDMSLTIKKFSKEEVAYYRQVEEEEKTDENIKLIEAFLTQLKAGKVPNKKLIQQYLAKQGQGNVRYDTILDYLRERFSDFDSFWVHRYDWFLGKKDPAKDHLLEGEALKQGSRYVYSIMPYRRRKYGTTSEEQLYVYVKDGKIYTPVFTNLNHIIAWY